MAEETLDIEIEDMKEGVLDDDENEELGEFEDPKCYICLSGIEVSNCRSCEKLCCQDHMVKTLTFFGLNEKKGFYLNMCQKCSTEGTKAEQTLFWIYAFALATVFVFVVLYSLINNVIMLVFMFVFSTLTQLFVMGFMTKKVLDLKYYRRLQIEAKNKLVDELTKKRNLNMMIFVRFFITTPLVFPLLLSVVIFPFFFFPRFVFFIASFWQESDV